MFIREIKKKLKKKNIQYEYIQHRLVESIRTEQGPRQQSVLNLGTLSIPSEHYKTLANLIEQNITNCEQASIFDTESEELKGLARQAKQDFRGQRE